MNQAAPWYLQPETGVAVVAVLTALAGWIRSWYQGREIKALKFRLLPQKPDYVRYRRPREGD